MRSACETGRLLLFSIEWVTFFAAVLLMGLVLVIPGYIVARGTLLSRAVAICVSPCLSIALYTMGGIVLALCGMCVSSNILLILVVLFALLLRLLISLKKGAMLDHVASTGRRSEETGVLSLGVLGLYGLVGVFAAFVYYVMCLDGPNSFANASDTCAHLNYVRAFVDSGTYSVLKVASSASLVATGGFYPAAWHVLAAISTTFTHLSVPMAANVVNYLILAFIFPSACALLLSKVFAGKPTELRVGSIACICFVGFPWIFLVWGQLLSNLLGFALVPVFVFLFDELLFSERSCVIQRATFLLLALVALVFAQPNAIFTAGIFCIPSIIKRARLSCEHGNCSLTIKRLLPVFVVVGIAMVWLVAYKAPFMRGVVSFDWKPSDSFAQSVANGLSLAYGSLQTSQLFLALLVLLGFIHLVADGNGRSLCGIYLFCFLIYVANNTAGFPHSHVLSGFWYNDPYRTGAMLAMASIPLASSGMSALLAAAFTFVRICNGQKGRGYVTATVVAILGLALLFPSYELPGFGVRRTGFGSFSELAASLYSHDNAGGIDDEEWEFLAKVKKLVGDDLVFNIPEDGSGVLYGASGMNILFRRFPAEAQDPAVVVLGKRLSELSIDSEVRCKVRAMGLRYVMMLDCHGDSGEGSLVTYANQPDLWSGVYSLDSETPGFELLLSEGDMRLYRIDDEYLS